MTAQVVTVASGDGTFNYAVAVPAGTTNGDLLIAVAASDWNTLANNQVPVAFTPLTTSGYDGGSNQVHVGIGWRIASSEPANYTFPVGGGADHVAAIIRVTGYDGTPTIAQVAPAVVSAGSAAINAPSITPNGSDDLLICIGVVDGANGGGSLNWPITGLTEHVDRQSTTWTSLVVGSLPDPSSPSGTKTLATSPSSHNKGAACTISIKSAAGGGGDVLGTATGSGGGTGAATGVRERVATAAGAGAGSGAATGTREVVATAGGAGAGAGAVAGTPEPGDTIGLAAGGGGGTGAAAGVRERVATAAGSGGGIGAAVGTREVVATAAGSAGGLGAALGAPEGTVPGLATGTGGGTGTATAVLEYVGLATGQGGGAGVAVGAVEADTDVTGAAAGHGGGVGLLLAVREVVGIAAGSGGGLGAAVVTPTITRGNSYRLTRTAPGATSPTPTRVAAELLERTTASGSLLEQGASSSRGGT